MFRGVTKILREQFAKAPEGQPRANQQHQRQGDFRHHQRGTGELASGSRACSARRLGEFTRERRVP